VDVLHRRYDEALSCPDVVGLSIGTRPDCVPEEVLDLLSEYSDRTHLWVEYGLQTIHDKTLETVNRWHTYAQFADAVARTKRRGIPICVHIILGLPDETYDMMMQTAEAVASMDLDGIKIHHLYISKNTALARQHEARPMKTLPLEEYVPLVCDVIERLPSRMVVQRLMGELSTEYVVAPVWGKSKGQILRLIDEEFGRRTTRQGIKAPIPIR
jgi:radical SAM protein (TIGR01212 family)